MAVVHLHLPSPANRAAACRPVNPADLIGRWVAPAGEGNLGLDLRADGIAVMRVAAASHQAEYYCTWTGSAEAVHLVHASGQTLEFPLAACTRDVLVLHLSPDSIATCRLLRQPDALASPSS